MNEVESDIETILSVSLSQIQFIFKYFYMTFIMDSGISYEKSSNSLHSFLQQHHQQQQQQQQQQQHHQLRLSVQQHQQQQQHLVDNSDKLHSDQSDQENQQQSDSCQQLYNRLQNCSSDGQLESQLPPFVSCTNPHGIDTILNRRGLVSMAGGSAGNTCTVADTLAAAALQQSAISRYRTNPTDHVRLVILIFTH